MGSYRRPTQPFGGMSSGMGADYNPNPSLRQQQINMVPLYASPRATRPVQTAGKGGGKGAPPAISPQPFGQQFNFPMMGMPAFGGYQTYNQGFQSPFQASSYGSFGPPPSMGFYSGFAPSSFYGAFANPYSYGGLGRSPMPMMQPFAQSNQGYQSFLGNQSAPTSYQTAPEPLPTAPIASPPAQEMTLLSNPPVVQPKGFLSGPTVSGLGPSAFNPSRRTQMSAFGSMRNPFNMFTSFIR